MTTTVMQHGAGSRGEFLTWVKLAAAVLGMMAAAGVLHALALSRGAPANLSVEGLGATRNALAGFILVETLFVPIESWLGARADGRSRLLTLGAGLFALGALAGADAAGRAAWWAVAGVGAGLLFGGTVAPTLQRLAARPARCIAATAATCAAALTLGAFAALVRAPQLLLAALVVGVAQAAVLLVSALLVVDPPRDPLPPGGGP